MIDKRIGKLAETGTRSYGDGGDDSFRSRSLRDSRLSALDDLLEGLEFDRGGSWRFCMGGKGIDCS